MQALPTVTIDASPLNLNEVEAQNVLTALQQVKGNKVQAARLLESATRLVPPSRPAQY